MSHPVVESIENRPTRERAADHVSDVLLHLEWTMEQAGQAHAAVATEGGNPKVRLALSDAIRDLSRVHQRLMHDTYFGTGHH